MQKIGKFKMRTLLLIFIILSFSSCYEEPDGLNPFEENYIPPAPTNLKLTQISDSEVRLSWNFVYEGEYQGEFQKALQGFKIEKKTNSGSFVEIASVDSDSTSFIDTGLSILDTCFYRVKAFTETNVSDFSTEKSIKTNFLAPTDLVITLVSDSKVSLNWKDNTTFEDGFKVERKEGSGDFTEIVVLPSDSTSFTDSELSTLQTYFYRVRAFTEVNISEFSNEGNTQTNFPAPSNLGITQITDSEVLLTWQDNTIFGEGFIVERKEDSGSFTEIATVGKDSTDFIDTGLLITKVYSYRVKAVSLVNSSNFSQEQSIQTDFPAPTNLQITDLSDSEVQLTWSDNSTFEDGFKIERKYVNNEFLEIAIIDKNINEYIDNEVLIETTYFYRVRAFTQTNNSIFTNEEPIQTHFPAPTNLQITSVSHSEVLLNWEDNSTFEEGFKIERQANGGGFMEVGIVSSNLTQFSDFDLDVTKSYSYKIRAFTNLNLSTGEAKTIHYNSFYSKKWAGSHTGDVVAVEFSPNQNKVLSASSDNTLRLWNVETGLSFWSRTHIDDVSSIAFNYDGSVIASGGNDKFLKVWNESGTEMWSKLHSSHVKQVAFSPDGSKIASGTSSGELKVWNVVDGALIWSENQTEEIISLEFSPTEDKLASASLDDTLKLWNVTTGLLHWEEPHSNDVGSISFSPDGEKIVSVGKDFALKMWNVSNDSLLWIQNNSSLNTQVCFSPDGSKILIGTVGNRIEMRDSNNGSFLWFGNHIGDITSITFNELGTLAFSTSLDNTIKVWNSSSGELLWTGNHNNIVYSCSSNNEGNRIVSGGKDNVLNLWELGGEWVIE
ncbi:MAG: hypothetical protein DWQ06_10530 [Calditrichaeota bacterium]|nr:MAG: hypothetical protein DWQ06_10530 [Calditrichota bacterium]